VSSRDINDILREEGEAAARAFRDGAKPYEPPPGSNSGDPGWRTDTDSESAQPNQPGQPEPDRLSVADFYAYLPAHSYLYRPTREMWPGSSVNAKISPVPVLDERGNPLFDTKGCPKQMSAAAWLDANKSVEQMTWAPGEPELIKDRHIVEGGFIEHRGASTFNLYRPPAIIPGNADRAGPWIDHITKLFGPDGRHITYWLAHRVQRPQEKINHALMLGGAPGIGKDTTLQPVKYAVGPWNFVEVSPIQVLGRFNGFVKSVIMRVSEARDLGDIDRFKYYDHMKSLIAAPPDVLRVDEKHLREYSVFNLTGVVIISNYLLNGIYLPADDRRHFVAWSHLTKEDFALDYWNELNRWYDAGGIGHVCAYLATLDLSGFDAKAAPPKTEAFWAIVDANRAPEDSEMADILDRLGNPEAVTLLRIADQADADFGMWLRDRKNRKQIAYRMETNGYVAVRNSAASDGLWRLHDKRQVIYAKSNLSVRDRYLAAQRLAGNRAW
jgi:hypothetical protein